MKRLLSIIGSVMIVMLIACTPQTKPYVVVNSFDHDIMDKAVVVTVDEVASYLPLARDGKVIIVKDKSGNVLPTQNDDLDGDGQWDELAFLINLKAGQSQEVVFHYADESELAGFPKRTNVRFGYKKEPFEEVVSEPRLKSTDSPTIQAFLQMEGPAWENDVVGFRNYYDARNGMDIFGKRTPDMVLDKVGIRGQKYHELDDWGMDILKVGNSLGAGAIALQIGDSLHRIGPCQEGSYRLVTEGPVRAIFELGYKDVVAQGRTYNIRHQISIYAGDHFYRSKVWIEGLQGDEFLVSGIVDKHDLPVIRDNHSDYVVIATHGPQAYTNENLGMALLVKNNLLVDQYPAPKEGEGIVQTHVVKLKADSPVDFNFVVGWEMQDEGFANEDYFIDKCKSSIDRMK